ncbi:SGNH/GDSL hydrolase family protein [Niabella sp. CC-SYL272]|uniref:SGNH/GDSL hydrolase family protein n=1 Tax=Niabella agricola TaxID=2891571 RepID=UPI001F411C3D|nr:SGNH/GDSL hydrolase family protein [Niabella agricola]MCF3107697.1 SGNH/GDSL hydrolase family protein [Niabella agricola]
MQNRRQFLGTIGWTGMAALSTTGYLFAGTERTSLSDAALIAAMFKQRDPVKWLFTGDSITQGAKHTHGMRAYPEIFAERVRWEMGRPRDMMINTAVSGNTTADVKSDFEWRVGQYHPQVVFFMLGTNDAAIQKGIAPDTFKANMTDLIERVRKLHAIPVLLSPNRIVVSMAQERAALGDYVAVLGELAASQSLVYADVWTAWDTELQRKYKGRQNDRLLNDPLHPNGYGHQEIAGLLFRTLSVYNPDMPSCGGPYYENKCW